MMITLLSALGGALLTALLVWYLTRPTRRAGATPAPVDWDADSLAEVRADPDPLAGVLLAGTDLVDALLYEQVHADHRLDIGWQPPTASQAWALAGDAVRARTGELERVA